MKCIACNNEVCGMIPTEKGYVCSICLIGKHFDQAVVLRQALAELIKLYNEKDPECPSCGGTTEADGSGHHPSCIVRVIQGVLE